MWWNGGQLVGLGQNARQVFCHDGHDHFGAAGADGQITHFYSFHLLFLFSVCGGMAAGSFFGEMGLSFFL